MKSDLLFHQLFIALEAEASFRCALMAGVWTIGGARARRAFWLRWVAHRRQYNDVMAEGGMFPAH